MDILGFMGLLLVLHFIADFLLQPHWMAVGKSVKFTILLQHLLRHFAVFFAGLCLVVDLQSALIVTSVSVFLHGLIDWNIWRGFKRLRKNAGPDYKFYADHWFYVVIGLDQLLHGLSMLIAVYVAASIGG